MYSVQTKKAPKKRVNKEKSLTQEVNLIHVWNIQVLMDCAHNLIKRSKWTSVRASELSEFFQNCLNVVVLMSIFSGDIWGKMLIYSVRFQLLNSTHRNSHIKLHRVFLFASYQQSCMGARALSRAHTGIRELQDKTENNWRKFVIEDANWKE